MPVQRDIGWNDYDSNSVAPFLCTIFRYILLVYIMNIFYEVAGNALELESMMTKLLIDTQHHQESMNYF